MRRLIATFLFTLCGALSLSAQNPADQLRERLKGNRLSFSYTLSSDSKAPLQGKGKVVIQGSMYVCDMEGGEKIWSDGKTRWTMDREAKEIYIEDVASSPDMLSDPEPFLASLKDLKVREDGKSLTAVYENGKHRINVSVSSIAELPTVAASPYFRPDVKKYSDSGWTVTDLR